MTEFKNGEIHDVVIREAGRFTDSRGWLIEIFRHDELPEKNFPAMCYLSETLSGFSRGPHVHREQSDLFGFIGPGDLKLYLWDTRKDSPSFGFKMTKVVGESFPCIVTIPCGVVHAYKCISERPTIVLNAPNRLYAGLGKKDEVDEIRYEDDPESPFILD